MPSIDTIPQDVYHLFDPDHDHVINEKNLDDFANNLKDLLRARLAKPVNQSRAIRFSSLGRPDRQIWFDAHPEEGSKEKLTGKTYFKFLFGDVIEQLLLLLVKESGHEVTNEQTQVEIDGITGSIDAIIDGVVVDAKSASPFGYKKFKQNTITEDDPFGYVEQLSGYASVLTPGEDAAWLAMDKVSADICVTPLRKVVIEHHKPAERIQHLKKVIENEEVPPICYPPEPDGKSGNIKLGTGCSYCPWKFRCYPDLRIFAYSTGPRFLVETHRVPDVPEISREMVNEQT